MGNKETVDHWKAGELSISDRNLSLRGAMLSSSQRDFFMWKQLDTLHTRWSTRVSVKAFFIMT